MKKVLLTILSLMLLAGFAAGQKALQYDPKKQVNNGKDMTLDFWVQVELAQTYQKWCDAYTALHPNIKFNITQGSNKDHFTKLGMALPTKTGPQLFHMHNSFTDQFMANLKPYDPKTFSPAALRKDFNFVDENVYDGKLYYMSLAGISCGVFYNKQMWAEAGLTDKDIPKTWSQLAAVAKKLTKYDASGNVTVAGFNYNEMSMEYLITAMNYQRGLAMFGKDGKTPIFNDTFKQSVQWLKDLYAVEKAGSTKLPMSILSFSQKTSAMTYIGTWFGNWMRQNAPDIKYGFFFMPSYDGKVPAAYDRINGEVSPAINGNVTNAEYAVINDFLLYLLSNDDFLLDFALKQYGTPTKKSLAANKDVQGDQVLGAVAKSMDRLIYPGALPDTYHAALKKYFYDEVMLNGMPIDEAMKACKEEIIDALDATDFVSIESKYPHAKELTF